MAQIKEFFFVFYKYFLRETVMLEILSYAKYGHLSTENSNLNFSTYEKLFLYTKPR